MASSPLPLAPASAPLVGVDDNNVAPNPTLSTTSAISSSVNFAESKSTARIGSGSSVTTTLAASMESCRIPRTAFLTDSTHVAHVSPSSAYRAVLRVVVAAAVALAAGILSLPPDDALRTVSSSAPNPVSLTVPTISDTSERTLESYSTVAVPLIMSTLTLVTPSTFRIADSTDEEHEEHVIPSIDRVASEFSTMVMNERKLH
mmetsp:Transcript_23231/g.50354  ORF Transcript_23231/g.50354 Transcript_23231/m.50354 type:complete len:203 (+) Transcript_23231:3122-3730(+)